MLSGVRSVANAGLLVSVISGSFGGVTLGDEGARVIRRSASAAVVVEGRPQFSRTNFLVL